MNGKYLNEKLVIILRKCCSSAQNRRKNLKIYFCSAKSIYPNLIVVFAVYGQVSMYNFDGDLNDHC